MCELQVLVPGMYDIPGKILFYTNIRLGDLFTRTIRLPMICVTSIKHTFDQQDC